MNTSLKVVAQALNKANKSGIFTLEESALVAKSLDSLGSLIDALSKNNPIAKDRESAQEEGKDVAPTAEEVKTTPKPRKRAPKK